MSVIMTVIPAVVVDVSAECSQVSAPSYDVPLALYIPDPEKLPAMRGDEMPGRFRAERRGISRGYRPEGRPPEPSGVAPVKNLATQELREPRKRA